MGGEDGRGTGRDIVVGLITPEAVRESDGFFRVELFVLSRSVRGVEVGIGEAVVDRREAGGAGVTGECHLYRGGLEREYAQSVARSVEGEVYENVYSIGCDQISGLLIGQRVDVAPRGEGTEASGEFIRARGVGVGEDLELGAVVILEEGKDVVGNDMVAEIGRDVSDFQQAGRRLVVRVLPGNPRESLGP